MTPRLLLGVDGGNTKTIAILATEDGTVVGTGRVDRRADMYAVGPDAAVSVYDEAIEVALAGAARDRIGAAAFSLAGADWPEDIALLEGRVRAWSPRTVVVNDAIGALRGAIPDGPGVVIVCGTGTATGARGSDGRTWHSGFWQEAQGAHELGVRTLQAVYRAELGIDPATALRDLVLAAMAEASVEALLHHASARTVSNRRDPAVVAGLLLDAADSGDPAAVAIVTQHGTSLGKTAVAAARRAGIRPSEPFALALTGGVFRHRAAALRAATMASVIAGAPGAELVPPTLEPAAGALLLAFDAAGLPTGPDVLDRVATTLASELFETSGAQLP